MPASASKNTRTAASLGCNVKKPLAQNSPAASKTTPTPRAGESACAALAATNEEPKASRAHTHSSAIQPLTAFASNSIAMYCSLMFASVSRSCIANARDISEGCSKSEANALPIHSTLTKGGISGVNRVINGGGLSHFKTDIQSIPIAGFACECFVLVRGSDTLFSLRQKPQAICIMLGAHQPKGLGLHTGLAVVHLRRVPDASPRCVCRNRSRSPATA